MVDISKGFSSRLASLQRLCANEAVGERPSALLVVPGIDGRNNKDALVVLKYLFEGSCGRDLLEGNLPDFLESLEEVVLLVQESSLSLLCTQAMRKVLQPWLDSLGGSLLVEYLPSAEQEGSVDLLQDWKCVNFKRMMLESVPAGRGVGIPVPLGYDDIADVEGWPLMQAFALDGVFHPTGFFTSRYRATDVSEFLQVLYRTVDAPCVHLAVETVLHSSLPHALQSLDLLDASPEQRSRRTAEDILGPLDMLYEFGELHCAEPADPNLRPVLLMGADTLHFSLPRSQLPRGWATRLIGSAEHLVVEGAEPSTGMRWCRTYLLQRGRCLDFLKDHDALVDDLDVDDAASSLDDDDVVGGGSQLAEQPTVFGSLGTITSAPRAPKLAQRIAPTVARAISRLEALYAKLWLSLRWAVRVAFASFSDVLEAGTFLQACMDELMRGNTGPAAASESATVTLPSGQTRTLQYPAELGLAAVALAGGERLQVHMDCLNAFGQVVTIDDIDDMGGSCWTYVRVAVHGVLLEGKTKSREEKRGCVAVGDTFLFSVGSQSVMGPSPEESAPANLLLLGDSVCLTHAIPYYRCLVGPGVEDASARRLLASARSTHMLAALGLGRLVESSTGGHERSALTVPVLTDHPLLPHSVAALKVFSAGLLVDKLDMPCLPMMLSIGAHIERMWSVDFTELCAQATARYSRGVPTSASLSALAAIQQFRGTEGVFILFKTRSFTAASLEKESVARRRAAAVDAEAQRRELAARQVRRAAGMLADDDDDSDDVMREIENIAGGGNIGEAASSNEVGAGGAGVAKARAEYPDSSGSDGLTPMQRSLQFNPLQRCLPSLPGSEDGPRHLALLIHANSRGQEALSSAIALWRAALRLHDVPEHRGGASAAPLPDCILAAFVAYVDARSYLPDYSESVVMQGGMGECDGICVDAATALELDAVAGRGAQGSSGLLGMQVSFALAEVRRAAQRRATLDRIHKTEEEKKEGGKGDVRPAQPGRGTQLVVVTGHPGSGISLYGPHLAARVGRALASGEHGSFSPDLPACTSVHLDLTRQNAAGDAAPGQALSAAWPHPGVAAHVLVVTLVQPPSWHAPLSDVLPLLCSLAGGTVSAVVSVVCPGALDAAIGADQQPGIGEELWRAACLEPLYTGQACDLVLCTDLAQEPSAQFTRLRSWVASANPQAVCVRATGMRLEEQQLEVILAKLAPVGLALAGTIEGTTTVCSRRVQCSLSCFAPPLPEKWSEKHARKPCRFSLSQLAEEPTTSSLHCLRTISVPPPPSSSTAPWSIPSLLFLLQHLFPQAAVSSTVTDTWRVPDNPTGETGLRRAITLSSTKVLAGRQRKHERSVFQAALHSAGEFSAGKGCLAGRVRSVHGSVLVVRQDKASGASTGYSMATIEASGGCILIRHADADEVPSSTSSSASSSSCNTLVLSGVLRPNDCAALLALFAQCCHTPLPPKPRVTRESLTHAELLALQHDDPAIAALPLPAGWYCDGQEYWGPHGVTNCSRELRPDMETLCVAYLERCNRKVDTYNLMLGKL